MSKGSKEQTGSLPAVEIFETLSRWGLSRLWAYVALLRGRSLVYAQADSTVAEQFQRRFGRSRCEAILSPFLLTQTGHDQTYAIIESMKENLERNLAFRLLARFLPHQKMSLTVRKALVAEGFHHVVLALEVQRLLEQGHSVRFYPARRRPFIEKEFSQANAAVPRLYHVWISLKAFLLRLMLPLWAGLKAIYEVLRDRGIIVRSLRAVEWGIAQLTEPTLSKTRAIDHELIYGCGDLQPQRILHVIDGTDISEDLRAHFEGRGIPFVLSRALPVPLRYFFSRILWDHLVLFALPCAALAIVYRLDVAVLRSLLSTALGVLRCEILCQHHRPRIFFTWDTYGFFANVRTMVFDRHGLKSIGYIHGAPAFAYYYYHYTYMHVLVCMGQSIGDMVMQKGVRCDRMIAIGHIQTQYTWEEIKTSGKRSDVRARTDRHVLVAFDTTLTRYWGITDEVLAVFYSGLLTLVERFSQIHLCLKRKNLEEIPAFQRLEQAFRQHPRVTICYDVLSYRLMAQADSVVAIAASTAGIEALSCRIPTIFFDPRPNGYGVNPYRRYSRFLCCSTPEELIERYVNLLNGSYPPAEVWDDLVQHESKYFESEPLTALRALLLSELDPNPQSTDRHCFAPTMIGKVESCSLQG